MRDEGRVCEMCMCLATGGVGMCGVGVAEDWVWDLIILWDRMSVGHLSVFGLRWCGWCWGSLTKGLEGEGWCYVCVCCESGTLHLSVMLMLLIA